MTYRFQKFTSVYPEFLKTFLAAHPARRNHSYRALHAEFVATRYGLADYYARHMRALGNEAEEIFASFEVLQKIWAQERGFRFNRSDWVQEIVAEQVRTFQPDVIYLQDLFLFVRPFRERIRAAAPDHALLVGWRASPTQDFESFRDLDLVLSAFPHHVERWKQLGIRAELLPLAFDPIVLDEVGQIDRSLEFTFVGQIGGAAGPHAERRRLLEELIAITPLQIWGSVSQPRTPLKQRLRRSIEARDPSALLQERKERRPAWVRPPLFGLDYYRVLGRSKLTLNHHSKMASGPYASNIRMYEATGMGACLLNDAKIDLDRYFEIDREVVSYENASDCAEKMKYLLEHDEERLAIGRAGQERTLRSHTFENRVGELDILLGQLLAKRPLGS